VRREAAGTGFSYANRVRMERGDWHGPLSSLSWRGRDKHLRAGLRLASFQRVYPGINISQQICFIRNIPGKRFDGKMLAVQKSSFFNGFCFLAKIDGYRETVTETYQVVKVAFRRAQEKYLHPSVVE